MPIKLKPETRRWLIVAVIFLAIVFNYTDRQIVSILKPVLKKQFQMDDAGYAVVINVFTVCYALMYPVAGWLVDKFGARLTMFFGVITWSVACIGGGLSRSLTQFTVFRGMLGTAEPTNFPAQLKVVAIWFSGKLRATANSFCVAGSSIGAIIAPPLVAWLAISFGWQTVFIVSGCVGLFIALLWLLIYQDPPKQILNETVNAEIIPLQTSFTWNQLWATKSLWGILLIRFISDPVWYFCLFWLPGYLQEKSGLTLARLGMVGWIPFLAADLGAIGLSIWSDRMVSNGKQPLRARKIMLTTAAIFAPLCALVPYLPNVTATLVVFSVIAIICLAWLFNLSVVIAEAFPVKNVASVLGIAGGCGAAGAVLFNYIVGQFIGKVGSNNLFLGMAVLHPIAVIILWKMIRPEIPKAVQLV
jgi:ACS family hexuronate transporter-like MFS transporter